MDAGDTIRARLIVAKMNKKIKGFSLSLRKGRAIITHLDGTTEKMSLAKIMRVF